MKFNWKKIFWGVIMVLVIMVVFFGVYSMAKDWPADAKFGWGEAIFIAVFLIAVFIVAKIIQVKRQENRSARRIARVINDPALLKEELNHPEILVGGKIQRIEKVYEYDGAGRRVGLDAEVEQGGVRIKQETIMPKVKPQPKKAEVKKKPVRPAVKKKGVKKR